MHRGFFRGRTPNASRIPPSKTPPAMLTDSFRISPDLPPNAKEGRPRGRFWRPRKIFRPDSISRQNAKHTIRPTRR